ncbi:MAG: hypothetical protein COA42_14240 [Alteromonadaceae bacterium]|nr:MAG: hypothetical protein COA42_14240 [Alteromonadaceae bacterium]
MRKLISVRLTALLLATLLSLSIFSAEPPPKISDLQHSQTLFKDGLYREAMDAANKFIHHSDASAEAVAKAVDLAVSSAIKLNEIEHFDSIVESALKKHPDNLFVLTTAARHYLKVSHGAKSTEDTLVRINSWRERRDISEHDRLRALQLINRAYTSIDQANSKQLPQELLIKIYTVYSQALWFNRSGNLVEMPNLTDINQPADFTATYVWQGDILAQEEQQQSFSDYLVPVPTSFSAAKSDAQRWRHLLAEAMATEGLVSSWAKLSWSKYLIKYLNISANSLLPIHLETPIDQLKENEAIFYKRYNEKYKDKRIQKITLPEDAVYIDLLKSIALQPQVNEFTEAATALLATIYENRNQRVQALKFWQRAEKLQTADIEYYRQKITQLSSPLGRLTALSNTDTDRKHEDIEYRYRNAKEVQFDITPVDTKKLVALLKSAASDRSSYYRIRNINSFTAMHKHSLTTAPIKSWREPLKFNSDHRDAAINVKLPANIDRPYFLAATLDEGNTSELLVWKSQNVLLQISAADKKIFYYVDGETGRPVANKPITFWGTPHEAEQESDAHHFIKHTNKDGLITLDQKKLEGFKWIVYAVDKDAVAFVNFNSYGRDDEEYDFEDLEKKFFFTTNQPVFRPGQSVKFKGVIGLVAPKLQNRRVKGEKVALSIEDPQGNIILEKTYVLDKFGGFDDVLTLDSNAPLGEYEVIIDDGSNYDVFLVEEYKKPEFSVSVNTANAIAVFGEKIKIEITADYYFGQKVRNAKVDYELSLSSDKETWYPKATWDWLFDPGYAWFPQTDLNFQIRDEESIWDSDRFPKKHSESGSVTIDPNSGVATIELDTSGLNPQDFAEFMDLDIELNVTDESRRTVSVEKTLRLSKSEYQTYLWFDQGFYQKGEAIVANVYAQAINGKPQKNDGVLTLYPKNSDKVLKHWVLPTDSLGNGTLEFSWNQPGRYRIEYLQTSPKGNVISSARELKILTKDGSQLAPEDEKLTLINKQGSYITGDKAQVFVASNLGTQQSVLLVSDSGITKRKGYSRIDTSPGGTVVDINIGSAKKSNKAVHALTFHNNIVSKKSLDIPVVPSKKLLNVALRSDKAQYAPGEEVTITAKITDTQGRAASGELIVAVYDAALEPFAASIPDHYIESLFYKVYEHPSRYWNFKHSPTNAAFSLDTRLGNQIMLFLGSQTTANKYPFYRNPYSNNMLNFLSDKRYQLFQDVSANYFSGGPDSVEEEVIVAGMRRSMARASDMKRNAMGVVDTISAEDIGRFPDSSMAESLQRITGLSVPKTGNTQAVEMRQNFLDSIYWHAGHKINRSGKTKFHFNAPDNLTTWKVAAWVIGKGNKVGESKTEFTVTKPMVLRMQTPRFLVEGDKVTLSANIANYSDAPETVVADITLDNKLQLIGNSTQQASIKVDSEFRADWTVQALSEGNSKVSMSATGQKSGDAMSLNLPIYKRGALVTETYSGTINKSTSSAQIPFTIPNKREAEQSHVQLDYSPYLLGPALKALPYLAAYPYGCSEQTLNRFLPSALALHTLDTMKFDVDKVMRMISAAPIDDNQAPVVLDRKTITDMVAQGLLALEKMQNGDGGWAWFPGRGKSYTHTTSVIMHGLSIAKQYDIEVNDPMFDQGLSWLESYQRRREAEYRTKLNTPHAITLDSGDAFVAMILAMNGSADQSYLDAVLENKLTQSHYGNILLAMAYHKLGLNAKRDELHRHLQQYIKVDKENQTAYLHPKSSGGWWHWYNSDIETQAFYLMFLTELASKDKSAPMLARYLLNNRSHGKFWESTRDSAFALQALLGYFQTTKGSTEDIDVTISLDGEVLAKQHFSAQNPDVFEGSLSIAADKLSKGQHNLDITKQGASNLYYTAYVNNYSKEDKIKSAGLDLKVKRRLFKLIESKTSPSGYRRIVVTETDILTSGELLEVELIVVSKNDYEYILMEDKKPAGFEALETRSGYQYSDSYPYVEYRDNRVSFFLHKLDRGEHVFRYRVKAEIPGTFTALPTSIEAMYSPKLRGNSESRQVKIEDRAVLGKT